MNKGIFLFLACLLAGCGQPKNTLNVLTFADYIDPQVVSDFERQFECKVVLDFFNSGDAVMAKLAGGGDVLYDIVCVGDGEVPTFNRLGLLAPLRAENLPNLKNVDPEFIQRSSDPEHRYSIPYCWFAMGLYVRKPKDGALDESWSLIFDPAKQRGSFLLVDESRTCIAVALSYKGYDVNSLNPKELLEARDLLIESKKRSLGFDVPAALQNRVKSGSATMALGFAGVDPKVPRDPDTYFFIPREGSYIGLDRLAIPAKARHRELAETFLNYLLDAKVGAQNAKALGMATANKAAKELLPAEIRNDPEIYPPPEVMRRLQFIKDVGEQTRLYDEIWTQIKAK